MHNISVDRLCCCLGLTLASFVHPRHDAHDSISQNGWFVAFEAKGWWSLIFVVVDDQLSMLRLNALCQCQQSLPTRNKDLIPLGKQIGVSRQK